jgi:hypothetical protein
MRCPSAWSTGIRPGNFLDSRSITKLWQESSALSCQWSNATSTWGKNVLILKEIKDLSEQHTSIMNENREDLFQESCQSKSSWNVLNHSYYSAKVMTIFVEQSIILWNWIFYSE